jgi:hypothetical protein
MQLFWFQTRKYYVAMLRDIINEKIRQLKPSDDDYPWLSFDELRKTNPYVSSIWEIIDLKEFASPSLVNGKWYRREIDKFFKNYLPDVTTEWYDGELYITTKSVNTIVKEMTDYHTKKQYAEQNLPELNTSPVIITDPRGDYFVGTPETIAKGSTIMLNILDYKADSVQGTGHTNHDTYGIYHDETHQRDILWVIDGATPLEQEPYPKALHRLVHLFSSHITDTLDATIPKKLPLKNICKIAIEHTKNQILKECPSYHIDVPHPEDKTFTDWLQSHGTFSIVIADVSTQKGVINEVLQLGDCGILVDGWYHTDRRVHRFRQLIDHRHDKLVAYKLVRGKANQPSGYAIGDLTGVGFDDAIIDYAFPFSTGFTLMSDGFYDIWNRYGSVPVSIEELAYKQENLIKRDDATYITHNCDKEGE